MRAILRAAARAGNSLQGIAGTRPDRLQLEPVDFPTALKERRAARRLSQLELAVRAGTTQRHLSFIESGRSAPGREMVIRLAESLGLPLRERNELLLKGSGRGRGVAGQGPGAGSGGGLRPPADGDVVGRKIFVSTFLAIWGRPARKI
jgi:DNA-binding XRE family transcriptional regulator